ncbi:MAG TPA: hypothetical protein VN034_14495 [Sphingopyxis sp.]|nr:hypothetical protein [Sphingopyxis sp.]
MATATPTTAEPTATVAPPPAPALLLRRDTPIHFMVVNEVTTKTHTPGHRFKLRVDKPVVVDGATIIPIGATAWGEVLAAKKSGNVGKGGSLEARLLYVESNGMQIPVSGTNNAKGASAGGETALGILALGPLGLFAKGNNAKIKAGELMTGFVEQDTEIPRAVPTGL